jgi:NAD(P)-dependent dehydrogenase (short-subunit alcohol dehydrogenase family)
MPLRTTAHDTQHRFPEELAVTSNAASRSAGLAGRVAVVTGASRGIGAATALTLADRGAAVALVGRSAKALDDVAEQVRAAGGVAVALVADLADRDAVAGIVPRAVAELGGFDILVNNAGTLPPATRSEQLSRADWDAVLALNLTAPWVLASQAHPALVERGGGVIVNVTSTAAYYPSIGLAHYCSSKAALEMTTKVLALEWARDGIRVVGIAPGRVDTDLVRPIVAYDQKRGARPNPLNRLGRPEEIAAAIAFVCSDDGGYLTGSTVVLDGGEIVGLATST